MTSGNVLVLVAFAAILMFALSLIAFRRRLAGLLDATRTDGPDSPHDVSTTVRFARGFLLVIGLLGMAIAFAVLVIGISVTS